MEKEVVAKIKGFCEETHGSSDYDQEDVFVKGEGEFDFAPLKFLIKKLPGLETQDDLVKKGYIVDAHDFLCDPNFKEWFELQFKRKLTSKKTKSILIVHFPNNKEIFDSIETVHKCYELLRHEKILMNSKNLAIQLGEWYGKSIFGLKQIKSSSQRGFDFYVGDKRVEVVADWGDVSSLKGIKIKKSLVELSEYCIIIYVAKDFRIREVCFLDSSFVLRKFTNKGHTLFLKDDDIRPYFFSESSRHADKVINKSAFMRYASPNLAMRMAEYF